VPYTLTWEPPNGACRTFSGGVTGVDLLGSLVELTGAAQFDGLRYSILIFSGVTGLEADRSTLEDIAAVDYGAYDCNSRFVSAIVADGELAGQLLRRFDGLNFSRIPRRFFSTEADARAWIDSILSANRPGMGWV